MTWQGFAGSLPYYLLNLKPALLPNLKKTISPFLTLGTPFVKHSDEEVYFNSKFSSSSDRKEQLIRNGQIVQKLSSFFPTYNVWEIIRLKNYF